MFSFWLVTFCAVFATAIPSLFSQSTVLHGHPSNVPIVCDVWQQPMDFIFTTPPSTAMTCYDYCIYNHIVYMYFVVPHALHTIPSTININQALLSSSLSLPSPGWQRPMATRQCPAAIWRPSSVTWTADTFAPCRRRWRSSCATFEAGSWRFGRCLGWMVLRWFWDDFWNVLTQMGDERNFI